MKRIVIGSLVLAVAAAMGSSQVVDPMMMSGEDVVGARKAVMRAINAQVAALRGSSQAGDLQAMKGAGVTLAALAGVLPMLFEDPHADAYPYQDSQFRYVAGDSEELLANARALQAAATAAANATRTSDLNIRAVFGSCSACHGTFREG